MHKKTETNVETIIVKAADLLKLQSIDGLSKTTALGFYANKILDVVGTLDQILSINSDFGAYALYAKPSNVTGCTAKYTLGRGWGGFIGAFTTDAEFRVAVPETTSVIEAGAACVLVDGVILSAKEV